MAEEWYEGAHFFRKMTFKFGDCDIQKRASLYAIMKLLSEISGDDYEGRGLGHDFLMNHGQVLLLSKLSLKILSLPLYSNCVVAETWERALSGPYFCREYEIKNEKMDRLISGTSRWFLADPISREILRPNTLLSGNRAADPAKSDCQECRKIEKPEDAPIVGLRQIYYSDLDANGHVNNAVYGKIATDFLPEKLRERNLKSFDINFNLETKLNETLEIQGMNSGKGYIIHGISDNKTHFCCEFVY